MLLDLLKLLASYVSWKSHPPISEEIPLYRATHTSSIHVFHELIKSGADINVQDGFGASSLCTAVYYRKTEAICLLLYYGADVEFVKLIGDGGLLDPNLLSVEDENFRDIIKVLLNSCTVIDDPRIEGYCSELISRHSIIGSFLVENRQSDKVLCELFLTIITQINPTRMLNFENPFLLIYLQSCDFSTANWLKCLYTILEFPFAADLVQHVAYFSRGSCFSDLLLAFKIRNVESRDRASIIWIWLSLGSVVSVADISTAIRYFGYNEELQALIYGFTSFKTRHAGTTVPAIVDILALETNYNFVQPIVSSSYLHSYYDSPQAIWKSLTFFAMAKSMKRQLLIKCQRTCTIDCTILSEKFEMLDGCPSLAELSRNQIRRTMKLAYVIKQPYHYYEIVKILKIPKIIKGIILFKEPLYNC